VANDVGYAPIVPALNRIPLTSTCTVLAKELDKVHLAEFHLVAEIGGGSAVDRLQLV
jgi:hypothetical protein